MNDTLENIFGPKLFFPFTIMEFKLSAEKSTKSNSANALIVIIESDKPSLELRIAESALARKINLNDKLQVDVNYPGNPDDQTIYMMIYYKFDLVAYKK
jgi:hypothetical protein